jgi:hypothetical protein
MTTQNNPLNYAQAIQYQLSSIVSPVFVYANFNRNFANQPKFITWQLRNIHQPVYTGSNKTVKGIDTPIFQINTFAQDMNDAFNISNSILQSLHGYSGLFGGSTGFQISKADVHWLYNTYDDMVKLNHIVMDCTLYIPT